MWTYLGLLVLGIFFIIFCNVTFHKAMGLCLDYWSDLQYKIWKILCAGIGVLFIIVGIFICIFNKDRFSDEMNTIVTALVISEFFSMTIFAQILHFIAWRKKRNILKNNILLIIAQNRSIDNKQVLLEICKLENRQKFTEKQIEKNFKKIINDFM